MSIYIAPTRRSPQRRWQPKSWLLSQSLACSYIMHIICLFNLLLLIKYFHTANIMRSRCDVKPNSHAPLTVSSHWRWSGFSISSTF